MVRLWICDKIKKMASSIGKNKKAFKVSLLVLFGFVILEGAAYFINQEKPSELVNIVDHSLALYSDRNITENAIIKDSKFESLAFAPVPPSQTNFYSNQFAGVVRAFKFVFLQNRDEGQGEYGTWIWTPTLQMTDEYMESILSEARREGINTIYLSIDSYLDIYVLPAGREREEKEKLFGSTLEKFISVASEKGIAVDAEAGWRNWAEEGHSYKAFVIVNYVKEFNDSHEHKFRGFQYDVEPYLLDYYLENKGVVLSNFIKLVDQTAHFLGNSDLKFSVVVPDFYDRKDRMTPSFVYGGETDFAFRHLLKVLEKKPDSSIIIMSYRNFAEGRDGSIEVSKNEMRTASLGRFSTAIILAQEVGDVPPPYITFHNTSKKHFLAESEKLSKVFDAYANFDGIAIHYANAFLSLAPE